MEFRQEALRKRDYPKHRDSVVKLIKEFGLKRIAEIGVYRGLTAERVLSELHHQILMYLMIDAWKPFGDKSPEGTEEDAGCPVGEDWTANYANAVRLKNRYSPGIQVTVLKLDSVVAARSVPEKFLDFVFIDADHSYPQCKNDIQAWLPKVDDNGIIAGHDYYTRWPGVVRAVDEVFPAEAIEFLPDTVWYVRKEVLNPA